ncbi:heme exporter protein CcmD [Bermanella sp. 47_1433_sub80_T6]|nr:heme exporter protein CcmD [Bermanella sp. 47_1433_sub80_T6]
MFFDDFSSFLAMGGHGLYVWLSYSLAAVIVAINFISPVLTRKKIIKDIERQLRREQK